MPRIGSDFLEDFVDRFFYFKSAVSESPHSAANVWAVRYSRELSSYDNRDSTYDRDLKVCGQFLIKAGYKDIYVRRLNEF